MGEHHPSLPVTATGLDALTIADRLAREAGALIRDAATRARTFERKGRNNLVTATDHASEQLIIDGLSTAFPDHRILSEESNPDTDPSRGWVWSIDPLDGTRNFASGIPIYCVNIALLLDGEAVLGATYDPNRDECLLGGPGLGLTSNGRAVTASVAPDLASAVIVADLGYDDHKAAMTLDTLRALWPGYQSVRIIGSAALGLAWAASGRADLNLHLLLYPWDIAAGLALVPAGGGIMLDRAGAPASIASETVVAGSSAVVHEFLQVAADHPWQ